MWRSDVVLFSVLFSRPLCCVVKFRLFSIIIIIAKIIDAGNCYSIKIYNFMSSRLVLAFHALFSLCAFGNAKTIRNSPGLIFHDSEHALIVTLKLYNI